MWTCNDWLAAESLWMNPTRPRLPVYACACVMANSKARGTCTYRKYGQELPSIRTHVKYIGSRMLECSHLVDVAKDGATDGRWSYGWGAVVCTWSIDGGRYSSFRNGSTYKTRLHQDCICMAWGHQHLLSNVWKLMCGSLMLHLNIHLTFGTHCQ